MGVKRNKEDIEKHYKLINPTPANHPKLHASTVNVCKFLYGNKMNYEMITKFRIECFRLAINNCLIDDDIEIMQGIVGRNNIVVGLPEGSNITVKDVIENNPDSWLLIFFERDGANNFPICVDTSKNIIYDALGMEAREFQLPVLHYFYRRIK